MDSDKILNWNCKYRECEADLTGKRGRSGLPKTYCNQECQRAEMRARREDLKARGVNGSFHRGFKPGSTGTW